ncbi:proteasome-type protease [Methylobrevis albus]|uniref:Proteasome-type protease n=1 Tax=Methylobrevis albus TaxID=2793297 RepID=A0A931I032_9HYPH|nr:proteasome-type protease [Methylobrevis albus]MBH0236944.1 proteasome-type protease [Methylobrevis albus]
MTYCVGILVREGLVMIADTRTNAGLDNIATYRKLHVFEKPGDRVISLATAGNLAVTQAVISILQEGIRSEEDGKVETIWTQPSMFRAAQFVGRAIREVFRIDGPALEQSAASFDVTMLLGGQVAGGRLRLFMVYRAGNFIEATEDTPYLQIGEHKYGKPILDRAIKFDTILEDALKIGLISMDSTMRSNLGVGMPIDLITVRRNAVAHDLLHRVEPGEPYFHDLRERWSAALRQAHQNIPRPPYVG